MPNCRCHADPPVLHGPYHQWTRKVGGKTVTRLLTDEQFANYGTWLDNERRLQSLIAELETLTLAIARQSASAFARQRHARPRPPETAQVGVAVLYRRGCLYGSVTLRC